VSAASGSLSIVGQVVIGPNDTDGISGYSLSSGARLWTQPNVQFCAAGNGKVVVLANDQLATLSATTGKQLSYDPNTSSCPTVLPNGASWSYDNDSNQLVVTQYF
jgi:hypothetical protein